MNSVGNGEISLCKLIEHIHKEFYYNPPKPVNGMGVPQVQTIVEAPQKKFNIPNIDGEFEAKLSGSSKEVLAKLSDDNNELKNFIVSTNSYKPIRDEINAKQKSVITLAKSNAELYDKIDKLKSEYEDSYNSAQKLLEDSVKLNKENEETMTVFE